MTNNMNTAPMGRKQTLAQQRAQSAWQNINKVDEIKTNGVKGKYGSLVRGLPAQIQRDGMGPTLAFLYAKGKKETHHEKVVEHLMSWLSVQFAIPAEQKDLMTWLLQQDSETYRQVTNEAQAYLFWLKRFAEAKDWKSENE